MVDDNANTDELETLRRTVSELTTAKHKLREKITALEGEVVTLKATAETAEAARYEAVVATPLRKMSAVVSPVPDLWLAEFSKAYRVEPDKDGNLVVMDIEQNKAARDRKGNAVDFSPNGLFRLLAAHAYTEKDADQRSRVFKHLMNYFGASGGAGNARETHPTENKPGERLTLGLR